MWRLQCLLLEWYLALQRQRAICIRRQLHIRFESYNAMDCMFKRCPNLKIKPFNLYYQGNSAHQPQSAAVQQAAAAAAAAAAAYCGSPLLSLQHHPHQTAGISAASPAFAAALAAQQAQASHLQFYDTTGNFFNKKEKPSLHYFSKWMFNIFKQLQLHNIIITIKHRCPLQVQLLERQQQLARQMQALTLGLPAPQMWYFIS